MITDSINHILKKNSKQRKQENSTSQKDPQNGITHTADDGTLTKIEQLIYTDTLINSGQIKLIRLSTLKEKLGDSWDIKSGEIMDLLQITVHDRLSPNDIYFPSSELDHVIVFSDKSMDEASLICAKILQDITEKFVGPTPNNEISISTAVKKVKNEVVFEKTTLQKLLDSLSTQPTNNEPEMIITLNRDHSQSFNNAAPQFDVVYRPVWDVRYEAISRYIVSSCTINENGDEILGYDALNEFEYRANVMNMDYDVMLDTIETMEDLFTNNFRAIFSIPLTYETLFNSVRLKDFLSKCHVIPEDLYQYICFTLMDFPSGVPTTKLKMITSSLLQYSNTIAVKLKTIPAVISGYKECGVKIITMDVQQNSPDNVIYWENLSSLVDRCNDERMYLTLSEVNNSSDLILAKEIGTHFMAGDAISPYKDTPGHMLRTSWQELCAKQR